MIFKNHELGEIFLIFLILEDQSLALLYFFLKIKKNNQSKITF